MLECKRLILHSFLSGGFWSRGILGFCWFVVDICDGLTIYVFYKDV